MKTAFYTVALGAALLLTGSRRGRAGRVFTSERDCTVDVKSLCAGVAPGEGHILACLQSHMSANSPWAVRQCCRRPSGPRSNARGTSINSAPPPHSATSPTA